MIELPKRVPRSVGKQFDKKDYYYRDVINDNININDIYSIIFDKDDLAFSMDKLIEILKQDESINLKFIDFDIALELDKKLNKNIAHKCYLIDDGLRKDRGYIDLTKLKNFSLKIPINYLMWGIKFNDSVDVYCFILEKRPPINYNACTSVNGNTKISYENYIKILNKIDELVNLNPKNAKEKVMLVSDYLQSCTQFVEGRKSESIHGNFVVTDLSEIQETGFVETVINEHYGLCMGIANASTLLLNNPVMNVEVESVYGSSHVWNKVLIDGVYYYFDNTWAITRNENICEDGLVALSFSKKYLFFGEKTAESIGHHIPSTVFLYGGTISENDMKEIDYEQKYVYQKKPIYKSIKEK